MATRTSWEYMDLLFTAGLVVVTFGAFAVIITKAGFARMWILVPLAPVITWALTIVLLRIRFHSFVNVGLLASLVPGTLSTMYGTALRAMFTVDWITIGVAWLFLLVFALVRWPVVRTGHPTRLARHPDHAVEADRGPAPQMTSAPSQAPPRRPLPMGPGFGALAFIPGPGSATHKATVAVADIQKNRQLATFCARCGASIPGNRAIGHECPNAGQPPSFCRYCGEPNAVDLHSCSSCGAQW